MSDWRQRVRDGLTRNMAVTSPSAEDPGLRGRTYAIPYEQVWRAARRLADGGLRGWRLVDADDYDGLIRAEARSGLLRRVDEIVIRITLDANAQTRVDARSSSRGGRGDLGSNARRLRSFFAALDQELGVPPGAEPPRLPVPPAPAKPPATARSDAGH
ncbi:MAG: DUF1499 domain-containing protein [bacterium]|jgi:hypothetical protein|nr:MAG: hypothetical protein DIU52_09985 [bacterium]